MMAAISGYHPRLQTRSARLGDGATIDPTPFRAPFLLILGGALHLPNDQIALLINADLFACGIATLVQTIGFGPFGIRLPIIMGVTAVSISPMLAMAARKMS